MYNSEDACKTMSLHVRRLDASLPHIHPSVYNVYKNLQFLPCSTPASTTVAWAHLRALRDTCHGSPDLGEGPVETTHIPHVHGMPREGDSTTGVHTCVETPEGVHAQWRQTGHQSDTHDACRAVNQWTTTGNWHTTICS